jgi:hypothetical protein
MDEQIQYKAGDVPVGDERRGIAPRTPRPRKGPAPVGTARRRKICLGEGEERYVELPGAARRGPPAPSWALLAGAGLSLLVAFGATVAVLLYRHEGVIFYPSLAIVNYSLRGLPLQPPALLAAALGLVALWIGVRRRSRPWTGGDALGLAVAAIVLVAAASPYRPVAHAVADGSVYQLASYRADAHIPELFLLFTCDATGTICRQVSAYASFDLATGRHVTGTPELVTDPATRGVTLRVAGYVIGVYTPDKPTES